MSGFEPLISSVRIGSCTNSHPGDCYGVDNTSGTSICLCTDIATLSQTLLVQILEFLTPQSQPIDYHWVTNGHGTSPQPRARSGQSYKHLCS